MSDLDNEEIEATKKLNIEYTEKFDESIVDMIQNFTERWVVQFVQHQDQFIEKQCIKRLKEKEYLVIFNINEEELDFIFKLGLSEYSKRKLGG